MTCNRCTAPIPDQAILCNDCTRALRVALTDLADLLPLLTDTAAKMTALGPRTGTIKRTGHGDGISVHPLDVADEVRAVVTPWVRMLVDERVIDGDVLPERLDNGPADTAALCSHLASRMSLVRQAGASSDLAADVLDPQQSLCLGYNDDGVPDVKPHYPPGEFVLANRPPLVELVRQVVGMDGKAPSIEDAIGDRRDEAMGRFMDPELARQLVNAWGHAVTERQVRRWISEDRMLVRRDMEGSPATIMPGSLVELAGAVKPGRRAS